MCENMAFVALENNRIVAIHMDRPINMNRIVDTAKQIIEWLDDGLDIKKIDVEIAKKHFGKPYKEDAQ